MYWRVRIAAPLVDSVEMYSRGVMVLRVRCVLRLYGTEIDSDGMRIPGWYFVYYGRVVQSVLAASKATSGSSSS